MVEAAEAEAKATSGCFLPFHLPRSLFLSIWPALLPPELLIAVAERAEHEATVAVGSSRRCLPSTFGPPEGKGRLERLEGSGGARFTCIFPPPDFSSPTYLRSVFLNGRYIIAGQRGGYLPMIFDF